MTFADIIALDEDHLFKFLCHAADYEVDGTGKSFLSFLNEKALEKACRDELTREQVRHWRAATQRVEAWLIEDRELLRKKRMKQAGIRGVISAKQ